MQLFKQKTPNPLERSTLRTSGKVLEDNRTSGATQSVLKDKRPVQKRQNLTGMPDHIKNGVESLSGMGLDNVRVHYNSQQPAQLNAHAYAEGTKIHLAPGQEKHLPHEAWHVVQQAQGRVSPNMQFKGSVALNDHPGLEHEADVMGAKAIQTKRHDTPALPISDNVSLSTPVVQRVKIAGINHNKDMNKEKLKKVLEKHVKEWAAQQKLDWKIVSDFFNRYGSDDSEFPSLDAFLNALHYDVRYMSPTGQPHTTQEAWTTARGWNARASGKSSTNLMEGDIRLYRTMDKTEYDKIVGGDKGALSGHLGDFKEALKYLYGKSSEEKVLVEFVISGRNMQRLYSNIAFPKDRSKSLQAIEDALKLENKGFSAKVGASQDQGYDKSGGIGLKAEQHGDAQYSLGIGKSKEPSQAFLNLVKEMHILASSDGESVTWGEKVSTTKSTSKSTSSPSRGNPAAASLATGIRRYLDRANVRVADELGDVPDEADLRAMHAPDVIDKKSPNKESSNKKNYADIADWKITENRGGGDCLFFALNNSEDQEEANQLRNEVVLQLNEQGTLQGLQVDMELPSMLEQSPHPELNELAEFAQTRQNIPTDAYYRLMSFQGTWAGRTEIRAFATLRHTNVYVIESSNGRVTEYTAGGATNDNLAQLPDTAFNPGNIVLYKTPNHWRRVTGRER